MPKDEIRPALEKVTIAYAYLLSVRATQQDLVTSYEAALKRIKH